MDRPALLDLDLVAAVDDLAEQVEDASQGDVAHRHGDGAAGVADLGAALEAVGGVHGDRAHAVVAQVLLDLEDHRVLAVRAAGLRLGTGQLLVLVVVGLAGLRVKVGLESGVDLGQVVGEDGLDHHAGDLLDAADVLAAAVLL